MKATEREAFEKAEKLLSTIEKHPLTIKVKADAAAEILVKRTAAVQAIEALKKEQAENLPKLQAILKAKEEKIKEAKGMLEKATDELRTAQAATFRENISFNSAIGTHERVLFDTYDPKLDEALTFFRDKLDFLRKPGRITKVGGKSEKNLINWTKKTSSESNVQAVHDALSYCGNAIHEVEKMKLEPELDEAKLQKLKDGIPSIDIYSEVTGQAPMARLAPTIVEPCEYTLEKLIEKVNKYLKTPTPKARI